MSQLLKVRGKSLECLIPAAELQGEEEAENHTTCVCFPALGGEKKTLKGPQRSSPGGTERERTRTASWVRPPSHSSSWDFTGILARPLKQPWSDILMLSPANKDVRASKGSAGASWEWKKSPERWGGWVSGGVRGGTAARDDPGTFPALPALPSPPEPQG